jgi:hypothetical protein
MKQIITTLFATIFSLSLFAQIATSAKAEFPNHKEYVAAMQQGLSQLNRMQTAPEFLEQSNYFNRIAENETEEWLPLYYSAYCSIMSVLMNNDKSKADEIIASANNLLDKANNLSVDNSEIMCLQSLAYTAGIGVDMMNRGMKYSQQANLILEKAKTLDNKNPRIYYLQAQSTFYTPEMFGGGKKSASPKLDEAMKYFTAFKPTDVLAPNWGMSQCQSLLDQCNGK